MNDIAGLRDYPLARRGFAMTSLIAGFTMATTRVEAQQITTDTTGIEAGDTKIPVPGGDLPAYFARPAKGANFPIVLVFEEIFGVHEHIKDVCRRFAKAGASSHRIERCDLVHRSRQRGSRRLGCEEVVDLRLRKSN